MSVMPASSTQGRTLLPAVTPVPGRAGTSTTVLAPLVLARARTRRNEHHRAGAAGAFDLMRDRRALEVDLDLVLARILAGLFDGHGNFVGLAITDAHVSTA